MTTAKMVYGFYLQTAINLAAVCKCARDHNIDLTLPSPRPAADCAPRPRPRPGPCEGLPAAPAQTQTQDQGRPQSAQEEAELPHTLQVVATETSSYHVY